MKSLSKQFLLSRGYCCGNGCLNCPYKTHLNMEKYIIEYVTKVNGKEIKLYHANISSNDNKEVMNVYVESLTTDVKLAKIFYDREEAEKVSNLFSNVHHNPKVITYKKAITDIGCKTNYSSFKNAPTDAEGEE